MSMDCPKCGDTQEDWQGHEKRTGEDSEGRPTFKIQHRCEECGCEFTDRRPYQ